MKTTCCTECWGECSIQVSGLATWTDEGIELVTCPRCRGTGEEPAPLARDTVPCPPPAFEVLS